jgi:hypothetical protein
MVQLIGFSKKTAPHSAEPENISGFFSRFSAFLILLPG